MPQFYFVASVVCFGVFGLCIGSFLNVVVYRLPLGMSLARPGSHCTSCGHPLAAKDNVPLFSWLFLRGRCRYCKAPISCRYFLVEGCNCLVWTLIALLWAKQSLFFAAGMAIAFSVLLCIALCDADTLIIPDSLQIALCVAALLCAPFDGAVSWQHKVVGMAAYGAVMMFFWLMCFPLFGREGLGLGDVKLAFGMGALLGWQKSVVAFCLCIAIALVGIACRALVLRKTRNPLPLAEEEQFAFGPYLVLGTMLAMFFGDKIVAAFAQLLWL